MTIAEILNWFEHLIRHEGYDLNEEMMIRVDAHDFVILDAMDSFRGHPTLLALGAGK